MNTEAKDVIAKILARELAGRMLFKRGMRDAEELAYRLADALIDSEDTDVVPVTDREGTVTISPAMFSNMVDEIDEWKRRALDAEDALASFARKKTT